MFYLKLCLRSSEYIFAFVKNIYKNSSVSNYSLSKIYFGPHLCTKIFRISDYPVVIHSILPHLTKLLLQKFLKLNDPLWCVIFYALFFFFFVKQCKEKFLILPVFYVLCHLLFISLLFRVHYQNKTNTIKG